MPRSDWLLCAFLLVSVFLLHPAAGVTLYPSAPGETFLEASDEASSGAINLTSAFPFYGYTERTVYVS